MTPLRFHGYSDDTFGEYGRSKIAHDNCANGEPGEPIRFLVRHGSDKLIVVGQYAAGSGGTWLVGVEMVEEDAPLPPWPIRIRPPHAGETPYSPTLEIDAPEGATVSDV